MTIEDADKIVWEYRRRSKLNAEEEFVYIEALEFLIEETGDPTYMVELGGYYYEQKDFELALKYYELAYECGHPWAPEGLGYIWYYGRTGEEDYEKAFKYYSEAADNGYIGAMRKVADMYKNGYYVEKDYGKYCEMIEKIYEDLQQYKGSRKSDVMMRLAEIRMEQGRDDEAYELMAGAKRELIGYLAGNPFFGDLTVMKWAVTDMYKLVDVDRADFDIYDLYEIMKEEAEVRFTCKGEPHTVESVKEDGGMSIRFDDEWYRSIDDFFLKAEIGGTRIPCLYFEMGAFRITKG